MNSRENERRGEKTIANIDKFYFGVLCEGDQRNGVADGGKGSHRRFFFFNVAYIIACACGDGCDPVPSKGVKYCL